MDPRKAFIVATVTAAIAPPDQRDAYTTALERDQSGAIAAFLDDPAVSLLAASVARGPNGQLQVRLANSPDYPQGCHFQVTILKHRAAAVAAADIPHGLRVTTTAQSPVASLYRLLSDLYCPMLGLAPGSAGSKDAISGAADQQLPPHLQELLLQVVAGLGAAARGGKEPGASDELLAVLSPVEELDHWATLAAGPPAAPATAAAQQVSSALEPLRQPLQALERGAIEGEWEGAREACSRVADAVRAAWAVRGTAVVGKGSGDSWAVAQLRMQHFLSLVGESVARFCQTNLLALDLWGAPFGAIKPALIGAAQLLESWAQEVAGLAQDLAAGDRRWEGAAWVDGRVAELRERVEQIYELREAADEMLSLLSGDDSAAPTVRAALAPLRQLRPHALATGSPAAAAAWRGTVGEFDTLMGAVEARVVARLRELLGASLLPSLAAAVSAAEQLRHTRKAPGRGSAAAASAVASAASGAPAASVAAQALQVLEELRDLGALLARPAIAAALLPERRALVKHVDGFLEHLQAELDDRRAAAADIVAAAGARDTTAGEEDSAEEDGGGSGSLAPIADLLSWAAQCRAKADTARDVLQLLTGRRQGGASTTSSSSSSANTADGQQGAGDAAAAAAAACLGAASELSHEATQLSKEALDGWQVATAAWLSGIAGWKTARLMSFDAASRRVSAHFSESLVVVLREVRQLQALGAVLRRDILEEAAVAAKFQRYGMVLRQCAHFYNTIGSQMIELQKPLMLEDALEFEKVLTAPRDAQGREITWRSAAALEGYTTRLSAVAGRLGEKNRRLRAAHGRLAAAVVALMGTDLARGRDRWAAGIKDMRALFARLEAEGYSREAQAVWRQHWDFQLGKALEVQFRQGLASLAGALPEVEVRLVLRSGRPALDPPLEEIRAALYRDHLGAFLNLPARMKGVSDLSERPGFFRWVADADPAGTARLYDAAEAALAALQSETRRLRDWAALAGAEAAAAAAAATSEAAASLSGNGGGSVAGQQGGLEGLVEAGCRGVADFEANLRGLKAAILELERLPAEIRVGGFRLATGPFRAAVEEGARRLRAAMGAVLLRRALAERRAMEDFLSAGEALLGRSAASTEEIGRAAQEARGLVARLGEVSQLRSRVEEKNHLLRQMGLAAAAAPAGVDLSEVTRRWDGFTGELQQFDARLEAQRERLQGDLARRIEGFKGDIAGFASRWQALRPREGPAAAGASPAVVLAQLEGVWAQLTELREAAKQHEQEAAALGLEAPDLPELEAVASDIAAARAGWARYAEFLKERDTLAHRDWLSMRDQVWKIEDFLSKWESAVSAAAPSMPSKAPPSLGAASAGGTAAGPADAASAAIAAVLLREVDSYRRCLPHLKTSLRGAGWEDAHWARLFSLIGIKAGAATKETLTLAHFLDRADAVVAAADAIRALDAQAQGEATIRKALSELRLWGLTREFTFVEPARPASAAAEKKRSGAAAATASAARPAGAAAAVPRTASGLGGGRAVPLITGWGEVLGEVSDRQALVGSLRQSPYYPLFKDEVSSWDAKLGLLQEGLAALNAIQRKWLYLEPIFARGALPGQAGRFRGVDGEFRAVVAHLHAARRVAAFADLPCPRERLAGMAAALDACQRALSEFLEEKRAAFPRFYFLGDDDLLEVLGQARSPAVLQGHLRKLFAGIHRVKLSPDGGSLTAMVSGEGESVDLPSPVTLGDAVESTLAFLATAMQGALRRGLATAMGGEGSGVFASAPAQVLGLLHALDFTARAEAAIKSGTIPRLASELRSQLAELARTDYLGNAILQAKKQAMVVDLMHACDVADALAAEPPVSPDEWPWAKQLRFYTSTTAAAPAGQKPPLQSGASDGGPAVAVRMAEAEFDYTWEYQGAAPRLVYTPLTDKAYLTLTQALALGFGGNPYGPAGTGKTESVKALGAALGRQVLVFNCDEEFDAASMGRIFAGLVLCGAWGCFDEFNRLGEDVLSAVSGQIQAIQSALREGAPSLDFMGRRIALDRAAGVFVTLNPAGKGYGGRSKLPDNLKQLFRPIAMTAPDNEIIAEVILTSEGFSEPRTLARRLVALFSLARDACSAQQHYDWGLRALKTSLGAAGQLLRELRKRRDQAVSPAAEAEVAVRAVCATKLPTLTFDDNRRFCALLSDAFPGVPITDASNPDLEAALKEAAAEEGLELTAPQITKALQLSLACDQRIGVILVGPTGAGKTTLWALLAAALGRLGRRPVVHRLNPKAVPRHQLLGSLNLDTREWSDGVLTAAARSAAREPPERRSWVVCDGDVDPGWIESLNSVLDDNRLLTLPNGERIRFGPNVNFLFECASLAFASPATVSRCGMVHLSEAAADWQAQLRRWAAKAGNGKVPAAQLEGWISDLLPHALDWAAARPGPIDPTRPGLLAAAFSHLSGPVPPKSRAEAAVALARGVGAHLLPAGRAALAKEVASWVGGGSATGLLDGPPADDPLALLDHSHSGSSGVGGTGDEGEEDEDAASTLARLQRLPSLLGRGGVGGAGAGDESGGNLVMTEGARRLLTLVAPWLRDLQPFLLVGPEGCGKATLLRHCFARLQCRGGISVAEVHCSAASGAAQVIDALVGACGKPVSTATGRVLRPESGRVILFLRDINLPRPDRYATVQLVELLQQLLAHGGYHDAGLDFVRVERVQIVATMVPGGVGRAVLSARLLSRLRVAAVDHPEPAEMEAVCAALLRERLEPGASSNGGGTRQATPATAAAQVPAVAAALVGLYGRLRTLCSPGAHGLGRLCEITPRDLSAAISGLGRYDLQETPLAIALAHEARRALGDRIATDSAATKAFESALAAALAAAGLPSGSAHRPTAGSASSTQKDYFSTLALSRDEREGSSSAGAGAGTLGVRLARLPGGAFAVVAGGALKSYEREVRDLGLLLVPEALERISALDRALSAAPDGGRAAGAGVVGALLLGPSGSGRRCTTHLVAHVHGFDVWTPRMARGYNARAFRSDLRDLLRSAGGPDGRRRLLLLEDHQLGDPGILEAINGLLSGGDAPGLWTADELAKEVAPLEAAREADGSWQGPPGAAGLRAYFFHRIRRNLRIVVCLETGRPELLQARLTANPALLNRASVQWWQSWADESLAPMAEAVLVAAEAKPDTDTPKSLHADQDQRRAGHKHGTEGDQAKAEAAGRTEAARAAVSLHASAAARLAASPRHFFALVRQYVAVFTAKQGQLLQQRSFLGGGLAKLSEAATRVGELGTEAEAQRGRLREKQREADAALAHIQTSMEAAAERRREVEVLRKRLAEDEGALKERRGKVEEQLADVQPLLDAARAAVGGIKSEHLTEIRSLRMAPDAIRDVLEGVLLLMGQEDTSWAAMRAFLGKRSVKEEIIDYDARRISPAMRAKVEKLLKTKGQSFEREVIYRASQAAGPMAGWVKANLSYATVLDRVAPLQSALDAVLSGLSESAAKLGQTEAELAALDADVARLKGEFQARVREAEALRLQLAKAEETLAAATGLLDKLSGERGRWDSQLAALGADLASLPKAALLVAAAVVHVAGRPEDDRAALLAEWSRTLGLPPGFNPVGFLFPEADALSWQARGLPGDALSVTNGAAVLAAVACPYIIDPSSRAAEWLRAQISATSGGSPPDAVRLQDPRLPNALELAVRFGKSLIVSEADTIEPLLYPLLRRDLTRGGGRAVVQIGDRTVDWDPAFRLYLVTRSPTAAADLSPDAAPLVTVANFTVTREGLEGRLLAITLAAERPELEAQRAALSGQASSLKMELADLERRLLRALASSSGNILEDSALLASLTETKKKASGAAAALKEGQRLTAALDVERDAYRPLAARAATLYFAICDLPAIDPMYRFSLNGFIATFEAAFTPDGLPDGTASAASGNGFAVQGAVAERIEFLGARLAALLHATVGRALLNRHQLPALLHLARAARPDAFPPLEWDLFLGRPAANSLAADPTPASSGTSQQRAATARPLPAWVPEERAGALSDLLSALPALESDARLADSQLWAPWVAGTGGGDGAAGSMEGESALPAAVVPRVSGLRGLLLVKALRPERLQAAMARFVCDLLHLPSISPPALSLRQIIDGAAVPGATTTLTAPPRSGAPGTAAYAPDSCGTTGKSPQQQQQQQQQLLQPPLLFITTPGADPSMELAEAAAAAVGRGALHEVAMGQGQGDAALALLKECAADGGWLVLKNCHLVTAWLPALERELHSLLGSSKATSSANHTAAPVTGHAAARAEAADSSGGRVNPRFRLFLTAEGHSGFPPTLLEACTKVTLEAPPGLKQNLARTIGAWPPAQSTPSSNSPLQAQLSFLLAWLHAILQERRSYVPLAWSRPYEFSAADLRAGMDVVSSAAAAAAVAGRGSGGSGSAGPWPALRGLLLGPVYGGRVDDAYDARVLKAHVRGIFDPFLLPDPSTGRARRSLPGLPSPLPAGATALDRSQWARLLDCLPERDSPEAFGLPANIERAAAAASGASALSALRRIAAAAAAAGVAAPGSGTTPGATGAPAAFDREQWTGRLAPLLQLWKRLLSVAPAGVRAAAVAAIAAGAAAAGAPRPSSARATAAVAVGAAPVGPLEEFVALESAHGAAVVGAVAASLGALAHTLEGTDPLTPDVQATGAALLRDAVPPDWERLWEGPDAPGDYIRAALARAAAIETVWAPAFAPSTAAPPRWQSQPLELRQLFRPGALLNALRQAAARGGSSGSNGTGAPIPGAALESLRLVTTFDPRRLPAGAAAVPLGGLLLQGAAFDGARLVPVAQGAPLSQPLPPLYACWLPPSAPPPHAAALAAPLYACRDRGALVAEVQLPVASADEAEGWALAGVAVVLPPG